MFLKEFCEMGIMFPFTNEESKIPRGGKKKKAWLTQDHRASKWWSHLTPNPVLFPLYSWLLQPVSSL